MAENAFCRRFDRVVSQKRVGLMAVLHNAAPGIQNSLVLNERGPALKVFWSRRWRDGRRAGARTRLPKPTRVVIEWLTKKTEPEGAGQETSGPLLSVRNVVEPGHPLRTR